MDNLTFLQNEKNSACSELVNFMIHILNNGSVFALNDEVFNESSKLISQNYQNKDIIRTVFF